MLSAEKSLVGSSESLEELVESAERRAFDGSPPVSTCTLAAGTNVFAGLDASVWRPLAPPSASRAATSS